MEPGESAVMVFNLSRVYYGRSSNRAKRAVDLLRRLVARHAKVSPESVVILNDVNEYIWSRGIKRPPRRVKVYIKVVKEEDKVKALVSLASKKAPVGPAGGK